MGLKILKNTNKNTTDNNISVYIYLSTYGGEIYIYIYIYIIGVITHTSRLNVFCIFSEKIVHFLRLRKSQNP